MSNLAFSQETEAGINELDNTTKIIPPSPTAASLGRYGEYKVGGSTGVPSISIPLFEVKGTSMSLPVSLSYHGSGVRVDDIASWVGMGWSLNAGGVITRNIAGYPDEKGKGLYTLYSQFNFDPEHRDDAFSLGPDMLLKLATGQYKGEPDTYSYNFMGYSGQFYIDHHGKVHHFSHTDLKFSRLLHLGKIPWFQVITGDGAILTFSGVEWTHVDDEKGSYDAESAWQLTSIKKGNDTYTFTYRDETFNEGFQYSEIGTAKLGVRTKCASYIDRNVIEGSVLTKKSLKLTSIQGPFGTVTFSGTEARLDLPGGKRLETITYKDQEVKFKTHYTSSSYSRGYSGGIKQRLFLDEVEILAGGKRKRYLLDYSNPEGLPATKSFAKDHWGYFNGANNYMLLPKTEGFQTGADRNANPETMEYGMLTKITFPTGGYTEFDWEPNSKSTLITEEVCSRLIDVDYYYDDEDDNGNLDPFRINEVKSWNLPIYATSKMKFWLTVGYLHENELEPGSVLFSVVNSQNEVVYSRSFEHDDTEKVTLENLTPGLYTFNLKNEMGVLDQISLNLDECNTEPKVHHTYYGGLRVKEITNYSAVYDKFNTVNYKYFNLTSHRTMTNSGYYRVVTQNCGAAGGNISSTTLYKRHSSSLFHFSRSVNYQVIRERFDDGSWNEYTYYKVPDKWGGNPYEAIITQDQSSKRNLLKQKRSINSDKKVVSSIYNHYSFIPKDSYSGIKADLEVWHPLNGGNYDHQIPHELYTKYSEWTRLDYTIQTTFHQKSEISSRTDYKYFHPELHLKPNQTTTTKSNGEVSNTVILYPRNFTNTDDKWNSLKNYFFNRPIESVSYIDDEITGGSLLDYNANGTIKNQSRLDFTAAINASDFKFSNGENDPSSSGAFSKASSYVGAEVDLSYDGYRLKNVSDRSGVATTYLWGYGNKYPVAKFQNITSDELTVLVGQSRIDNIKTANDNGVLKEELEAIRDLLPTKAMMTSFLYRSGIGVVEITDPNGRSAYFGYDDFGRLLTVTDDDGNLVSEYEYLYALEGE